MARATKRASAGRVSIPKGTRRVDGLVLGTKSRAEKVDRSERARAKMYELIEAHPESAEVLLDRAAQARPAPLTRGAQPGAVPHRYTKKPPTQPPAKPYVAEDIVAHPTLAGVQEKVTRIVNTIEHMRQRKQLTAHQYKAAERMWVSHETIYGQTGGVMDLDRARGGGSPGGPPAPPYILAAEYLSYAKRALYALDHRVVVLVACEGRSIEETAEIIYRRPATRPDKEEIGRSLRAGLRELADRWFGGSDREERRDAIVTHHDADVNPKAKPYAVGIAPVERGNVVHATGQKVFRNK